MSEPAGRTRPRRRVLTLMVIVAGFAVPLGLLASVRRSADLRRRADFHQTAASILSEEGGSGCMDSWPDQSNEALFDPVLRKAYLYHHQLAIACSRAASRPWRFVRSDPSPSWAYPEVLREVLQASAGSQ